MTHPIHQAYIEAIDKATGQGEASVIPLGETVLCDIDSTDLTSDPRSGGYMFGSYAVGPCCVERHEAMVRGYGEERYIRGRCPEGISFADWVRGMRGPDAAIRVTPGLAGGAS
jgi:hypothetical protein